jgi:membrane protein
MKLRELVGIAKQTFAEWSDDGAPRLAAALSYYTVFSLAPLLFIVVALIGIFYADADAMLRDRIAGVLGDDAAAFLADTAAESGPSGGIWATIIGVVFLFLGAAGVFGQLQDALNTIWGVRPKPGQGVMGFLRQRFFSFALVGGTAFLLLVSLIATTAISAAIDSLSAALPGGAFLWQAVNFVIAIAMSTLIFALVFKVVPDAVIAWRHVWAGAFLTAVLFTVGQIVLGLYLGWQADNSVYGAAGSLIVVLLWVYYASQILFFGAEFTQVTASRRGAPIVPARNAERIYGADEDLPDSADAQNLSADDRPSMQLATLAFYAGDSVGRFLRPRTARRR